MRFYLDEDDTDARLTLRCPLGSPVPRVGEAVQLHGQLYDVVRVAYDFPADGAAPETTITVGFAP
jgi:hypothetical protein